MPPKRDPLTRIASIRANIISLVSSALATIQDHKVLEGVQPPADVHAAVDLHAQLKRDHTSLLNKVNNLVGLANEWRALRTDNEYISHSNSQNKSYISQTMWIPFIVGYVNQRHCGKDVAKSRKRTKWGQRSGAGKWEYREETKAETDEIRINGQSQTSSDMGTAERKCRDQSEHSILTL